MKLLVVLLGIIVIVLLYILINYYSNGYSKLATITSLKNANTVVGTNLQFSTRYALGIWIYVNSWDSTANKVIYELPGKIKLFLDKTRPSLNAELNVQNAESLMVSITDEFPLQKWVYVTVSVDNNFVDFYLEGKLVKSNKLPGIHSDGNDSKIFIGGNPANLTDIVIARFNEWQNPLSQTEVYNNYMKGNGSSVFHKMLSSYGLNVSVLKDNVTTSSYRVF